MPISAISFEVRIYAHSSSGISGIKAGFFEILSSKLLVGHYEYDRVGENTEAPVQWLDASLLWAIRN